MNRVLIVEDDAALVMGLTTALEAEGYEVQVARTGPEGLRLALEERPDLILLDLMLPGMSGLEVCKRIRDRHLRCAVITKPFSLRELLARVRAHFRRGEVAVAEGKSQPSRLRFGDVVVDLDRHEVHRAGKLRPLTHREFRLLEFLIRHPGEVLTRERLLKEAWGHAESQTTRTVDNHVLRLRKHIEPDPERPCYIRTARGDGYLFDPTPPSGGAPLP